MIKHRKTNLLFRHNLSKHPLYGTWLGIRNRCNSPNHIAYKYYGGRGIKMCGRWDNFANFLEDMGNRPEGFTIDRIDPNGKYEPSNCRWATLSEQSLNQRINKCNTSGVIGVGFHKQSRKWQAYHKNKTIGRYATKAKAIQARSDYV